MKRGILPKPKTSSCVRLQEGRLQRRLAKLRLEMDVMAGDGNCMFRAISHELWGTPRFHPNIRRKAVRWMKCVSLCVRCVWFMMCDAAEHGERVRGAPAVMQYALARYQQGYSNPPTCCFCP